MRTMTRREFTAYLGGVSAALGLPGCGLFRTGADSYSVPVLGDMHYDAFPREKFHAKAMRLWAEKGGVHPERIREFDRNAKMWQDLCKRILESSAAVRRDDAAFLLQLGDLVQGDCEDNALHMRMLKEATDLLESAFPGLPVVSLCGNHDVREGSDDVGAAKPYAERMIPYESKQLAAFAPDGFASTTFGFRRGRDLWIVLDFNFGARDVGIVRRLLAENQDVRYTFVATHGPVLPMSIWKCRWFYLGSPEEDALRREMRTLFAKRQAIILAGHVHSLELKDWYGDGGRITEMVLNTCAGRSDGTYFPAEPQVVSEDAVTYGDWGEKELFDEYRPGIRRYFVSRAVGHHVLHVGDDGVTLDYYGHDARVPTKSFLLR